MKHPLENPDRKTENKIEQVEYYINKFTSIPEERWHTKAYYNDSKSKFCAAGHCGHTESRTTGEGLNLCLVMAELGLIVASVNDGEHPNYQQPTPKQRILAALTDIKNKLISEQPKPVLESEKVRTVYVSFDKKVRELTEEVVNCN